MDMNLQWRKATYSSGNGGNCIEVATADRTVAVRDSKDPDGPRLAFGMRAWQAFAARVKGERSLVPQPPDEMALVEFRGPVQGHASAGSVRLAARRAAMPSRTQSRLNWKRSSLVSGSSGSTPDSISRVMCG